MTIVSASAFVTLIEQGDARAATLTASYEAGHLDVSINDYHATGLGTFRLVDGADSMPALCIEADRPHSSADDAYRQVAAGTPSHELDTLIWLISQAPPNDDTATAAAALAWFYAGAERTIGEPVWSNWALDYQPIGPLSPESWDNLAPFALSHPVGVRSGGADLDAVEHRIAALHRQVLGLAGPWQLTAVPDRTAFRLVGSVAPIGGRTVTITVTSPGADPSISRVLTDVDGYAAVAFDHTAHPDGATIHAAVGAPGAHREWDGEGAVQRMITATEVRLTAGFEVAPAARHMAVQKHSADPTIGVADGVFALVDARATEVERVVTDSGGRAGFAPIDPVLHPAPYTVHEIEPPPGLARSAPDVTVSDASTLADQPTIAEFTDDPLTIPLSVRKDLSSPVGPADRSGFGFSIVRAQDGRAVEVSTGPDGVTDLTRLPIGTYEVCETTAPAWAVALEDTGCRTVEIDLDRALAGITITVPYLNVVPPPSIDTVARDAVDGDRILATSGGRVVDEVMLTGLVPGSNYTLVADLVRLDSGDSPDPTDVVMTTTIEFGSDSPTATLEVGFEIPALEETTLVVIERLFAGGQLVAVHDDLTDLDQTVTVVAPATTTTTTTTTPTTTTTATTPRSSMLPRTGGDETTRLLRLGDTGFVVGVALIAITGLMPCRRSDEE